jgi:CRISPR-associated protein Csc3
MDEEAYAQRGFAALDEDDEPEVTPEEAWAAEQAAAREAAEDEQQELLAAEPLFSALLKRTLAKTSPDDAVLQDYASMVVPNLSLELAHKTAKGGDFAREHRAEGRERAGDYSYDQSLRAHLVNGLLPAAQVARTLLRWEVDCFVDDWDEYTYRLLCAGYTLHDWGKLPAVQEELAAAGLDYTVSVAQHLSLVEEIFVRWCERLGLDDFLAAIGGVEANLHDLIFIASNTQTQSGTLRNLAALPGLRAGGRSRQLATDLSRLADLLAYVARTPVEAAAHATIGGVLENLSDGQARLTCHHLADVRGVVTNLINNAALSSFAVADMREPLLYAPSGVVYLERNGAPVPPEVADVAEMAVAKIRGLCQQQLKRQLIGFGRDGKGLKHADYYWLFFSPRQLPEVAARAAMVRITAGGTKQPSAPKRFAKMRDEKLVADAIDLDLPGDIAVDRLAELCAMLADVVKEHAPELDAMTLILKELDLEDVADTVTEIPFRGGTPYPWYYAAGVYRQRTPGLSDAEWEEQLYELAEAVARNLSDQLSAQATGWDVLRRYVHEHLRFGSGATQGITERVAAELAQYGGARKSRGGTVVCSLCHAPYEVGQQQEAAILFAPQVYTNKQPLHGGKAIRHMCAVCGMELMLRQVLMNTSSAVGKRFEGRRFRYLFFYPSYFFTTETLGMLRELQTELRRLSFTTLRKALLPADKYAEPRADLSLRTLQHIQDLLLDPTVRQSPADDRLFRLRYDEREPMTFSFLGIPPTSRDAKDAEAWIHPAFLALVLPLLLDVKVVASESMLPLIQEATELPETVLFDSPHQFVSYLTGSTRLNLDEVGPALQQLATAYLIHLDGNAGTGSGGYDYRWSKMAALARDLATSPLYAFHYLKRWQRRESLDSFGAWKAALYVDLVYRYLHGKECRDMTHAQELTARYRRFYRAEKLNSNAILRPLSVAASAVLEADPRLFASDEALEEVVRGELRSFMDRVMNNRADGRLPKGSTHETREEAIGAFSAYVVREIYRGAFAGDRAALRGKQLNLLKNACEALYLDAWRNERSEERVEEKTQGEINQ